MTDSFSPDLKMAAMISGLVLAVVYLIAIAMKFVYSNYLESNDDHYYQHFDF